MAKPRLNKGKQRKIALERIAQLFTQANKVYAKEPHFSHRYVEIARKIAMKVQLSIPLPYKRQYCKHCYKFLVPSKNARVRIQHKKVITTCLECKKHLRIPLKKTSSQA